MIVNTLNIDTHEQNRKWDGAEAALWRLTRDLYAAARIPHPENAIEVIEPPFWSRFSTRRVFGCIPIPEILPVLLIIKHIHIGVEDQPFCGGTFYTEAFTRKGAFKEAFRKLTAPEEVIRDLGSPSLSPFDAVVAVGPPRSRYLELFRFKPTPM